MKKLLYILSLLLLSSCMTLKQADKYCASKDHVSIIDTIIYTEITKDTTIVIESDSTLLSYYIECGDSNQSYIEKIKELQGKGIKTEVIFKDHIVYIKVKTDKKYLHFLLKSVFEKSKYYKGTRAIEYKAEPMKWWVKFLLWSGVLFYFLVILFLFYVYLKTKFFKI